MTNYQIKTYSELTAIESTLFIKFCKTAFKENLPASANMWKKDWDKGSNDTLLFLLNYTNRYSLPNGEFFVLFEDNKIIGCSGVYISDFSKDIAVAGVRTWIAKSHRHMLLNKEFLLPIQKKWAINRGLKAIALTFNEYNKSIVKIFKRIRLGESPTRITSRKEHQLFFNGLNELPFTVTVQYTPQYLIYEILDTSFNFNWETIKHTP